MATHEEFSEVTAYRTLLLFTQLIFSGKRHWLPDLAQKLECSESTITQIIAAIEGAGVAKISSNIEDNKRWFQLIYMPNPLQRNMTEGEIEKLVFCRDLLERLLPINIEQVIANGIVAMTGLARLPKEK